MSEKLILSLIIKLFRQTLEQLSTLHLGVALVLHSTALTGPGL